MNRRQLFGTAGIAAIGGATTQTASAEPQRHDFALNELSSRLMYERGVERAMGFLNDVMLNNDLDVSVRIAAASQLGALSLEAGEDLMLRHYGIGFPVRTVAHGEM